MRRPDLRHLKTYVGTICHIEARCEGGLRFNAKQSEEENRSPENLIAMCAKHSKVIDGPTWKDYDVELLKRWKAEAERPTKASGVGVQLTNSPGAKVISTVGQTGNNVIMAPDDHQATDINFRFVKRRSDLSTTYLEVFPASGRFADWWIAVPRANSFEIAVGSRGVPTGQGMLTDFVENRTSTDINGVEISWAGCGGARMALDRHQSLFLEFRGPAPNTFWFGKMKPDKTGQLVISTEEFAGQFDLSRLRPIFDDEV